MTRKFCRNLVLTMMSIILISANANAADDKPKKKSRDTHISDIKFDFRGVKLGIPLSEFKSIPAAPSPDQLHDMQITRTQSFAVCSDEPRDSAFSWWPKAMPGTEEKGGVSCTWAYLRNTKYRTQGEQAMMVIGGYAAGNYRFNFVQLKDDPEPVLFSIDIPFGEPGFESVTAGLIDKFGPPSSSGNTKVSNALGAVFDSKVLKWNGGKYSIVATQRFTEIGESYLSYVMQPHMNEANKSYIQAQKSKAGI